MATTKHCSKCSKEYAKKPKQAYWQYELSQFCSRSCKGLSQGFQKVGQPEKVCSVCSTKYQKKSSCSLKRWVQSKYCSQVCYKKRVVSEITKEKMSLKHKGVKTTLGYKHTDVAKQRMVEAKKLQWEGVVKKGRFNPRANGLYRSWRLEILKRDDFKCQECGMEQNKARLEIHHISSFRDFPELRMESSNVVTLCRECHIKTENYGHKAITYGNAS